MNFKNLLAFSLGLFFVMNSLAQTYTSKQMACRNKLLSELKAVMSKDNGLIQAQLMLTATKLAKKTLSRMKNVGLTANPLEAYVQDIVGNKTIERLNQNSSIQSEVLDLFNKHSKSVKYQDAKVQLDRLRWEERLSDEDIAKYMIQMQTIWKGTSNEFDFTEKDYAMAWFVNTAKKNATNKNSYFISNTVQTLLEDVDSAEDKIAKNMAKAQLQLKAGLQKLKHDVFSKHKEICLDLYDSNSNENTQNVSIFENISCDHKEQKLLSDLFEKSLQDILGGLDAPNFTPGTLKLVNHMKLSPGQIRQWQDWINNQSDNKERIVQYYKSGLAAQNTQKPKCDGFVIVDKKNSTTTLYTNDGEEVMTSPTVLGVGHMRKTGTGIYKQFNPDSILRRWGSKANGDLRYSKTTGAGIFYANKKISKDERDKRKYDEEFNDRVMVLYTKRAGAPKEEIQALHGVPNKPWVQSTHKARMESFENSVVEDKKLSSGCVNLEGYTYDIVDEFIQNDCPLYVLPEDPDNYFVVKNGELRFGSGVKDRYTKSENANIILSDGEKIKDHNNHNVYNFTQRDHKLYISGYDKDKVQSPVLDELFVNSKSLMSDKSYIESDDFQDIAALTYAITEDKTKANDIFNKLYKGYEQFRSKASSSSLEAFEKASMKERRKILIKAYKLNNSLLLSEKELLNKANEVEFVK